MAEVVNLRQARKNKTRQSKEAQAQANRALFGRTSGEKERDRRTAEHAARFVDAHRRAAPEEHRD